MTESRVCSSVSWIVFNLILKKDIISGSLQLGLESWNTNHRALWSKLPRQLTPLLDTIQDFLGKLGIKPHIYLLKIIIFSLYNIIVRPTKISWKTTEFWFSWSFFSVENQWNLSEFFFQWRISDYLGEQLLLMIFFFKNVSNFCRLP